VPARFFEKFDGTFDELFSVLGDGLLASYLLAVDQVKNEVESAAFDEKDFNFNLPPEEAIRYFRGKRVVRSKEFNDLRDEARQAAFTVGGVYRDDVLEGFKKEIALALEKGTPQREVIKRFRSILDGAGHRELGSFHLETVFRTNMQMAYGVGRRRSMEDVSDVLPYWQYSAVMDDRTRPSHSALHGMILPANHPFWDSHFPPWDFNCRCTVTAVSSIPGNYDHSNPSGEAQLVYDRDGNPAKAEMGTAVYDLHGGKFQGVPPQGGLREVIEGAATRARN
jgi:SPP1 gp7 family putative phage head morphogenesis protein